MFKVSNFKDWDDSFVELLCHVGFPRDTLLKEYMFKTRDNKVLRADYVISINEPLAIIEIKAGKIDLQTETRRIKEMVMSYDGDIEWYLVILQDLPDGGKYYKFNRFEQKLEPISAFPTYDYFKSVKRKRIIDNLNESNDWFRWVATVLGIILIAYYGYIVHFLALDIKTNQLVILWAAIVLILFPFFTKIKIAWLEIERMPKNKEVEPIKKSKIP